MVLLASLSRSEQSTTEVNVGWQPRSDSEWATFDPDLLAHYSHGAQKVRKVMLNCACQRLIVA